MYSVGDEIPDEEEVRKQLDRVRNSKRFSRAGRSLKFLEVLVTRSLENIVSYEPELGITVFDRREGWVPLDDSSVRTGRINLQKFLDEYYVDEGAQDSVVIEIPDGSIYRAVFSFNPASLAEKAYQTGQGKLADMLLGWGRESFMEVFALTESRSAMWGGLLEPEADFGEALEHDPKYAAAALGIGEALFTRLLLWEFDPVLNLPNIETAAATALELDSNMWRANVLLAAVYSCECEWELATRSFELARKNGSLGAYDIWSLMFHMATSKEGEALRLSEEGIRNRPNDATAYTTYGLALYMTRNFKEAYGCLIKAQRLRMKQDKGCWFAVLLRACVCLALGKSQKALLLLKQFREISYTQGFLAVALANTGDVEEAIGLARGMKYSARSHYVPWFQYALAAMAIGYAEGALTGLEEAYEHGDPWMSFIRFWPIFDPLRDDERFAKLIEETKSPPLSFRRG